jgi:hypothetical protein
MTTNNLTIFGMVHGHPAFRNTIDPAQTSPQGLACCHDMIGQLATGAEAADVPFPLVPDSAQRLVWGVPFLDDLDEVCRGAFERVLTGWPGHVFSLMDVRQPRNRRLAAGVFMPHDSLEDLFEVMNAGKTGELLATGLLVPEDDSAEAHDAFGELAQVMLVAALSQRMLAGLEQGEGALEPFTPHDLLDARPALLLNALVADSQEFAGRLISFAGHYALALLANPPQAT